METLVVYASRKGNTRRIAEEIARIMAGDGPVELLEVSDAPRSLPESDMLFVGGPTEGHAASPPMVEFLDRLAPESITGRFTAVFDTRLAWPRVLSGSAAAVIAERLHAAGAVSAGAPESFIVTMKPDLKPGELERAARWAREVSATVAGRVPALATR
jgi:flavorubredoxin